jgi:hypothetical protein
MKWTTMVDESTLNLTVTLHSTTQTRCIVVPKAKGDALITLNNISCCFFRYFTIVVHLNFCESTAKFHPQAFREKTRPDTHKQGILVCTPVPYLPLPFQ